MASSSSSSSALTVGKHDVFVSYRGEDTRKTFVDHLYDALRRNGISFFHDAETLERGKSIGPELLKAIGESSIAVIIFSNNYVSSSWCLDELKEIMKLQKEGKLIVYPVFYGVDPSDVRKQKGLFGEGFSRHQGEKVEGWRDALVEAATLSGWNKEDIANGHEADCIKSIIKDIQGTLYQKLPILEENLIGLAPRVKKLKSLLRMRSTVVRMIGIWGMGGAGKTTLARAVFDELSNQFDNAKFIGNIRENTKKSSLLFVQKEMLLPMVGNVEIQNESQGAQMIRKMFCHEKVLIVLDDVDHVSQLNALAGDHNWFGEGSLIIITTRDEALLRRPRISVDIYNVELLNGDEALQLFCRYAFRMNSPIHDYVQHSRLVVRYASGHPLTLKVLGNSLCGRDITEWVTTVDRLKEIPKELTLETLKISFDALEEIQKKIFLDIVCFFKGWRTETIYEILDSCGFDTKKWVSDLIQRSLIYISNEKLEMHDMIQELGQYIVRGNNNTPPEKHSRLWIHDEVLDVFTECKGTEEIEAIVVKSLHIPESVNFAHAFRNMTNLRLLWVDTKGMQFLEPEYFPSSLQYLHWENYTPSSRSTSFGSLAQHVPWKGMKAKKLPKLPISSLSKLVELRMNHSGVVRLWEGVKRLHYLKIICCSESKKLTKTPNFTGLPNLELLDFSGCSSLIEVHESIGTLEKLEILDLSNCYRLRSFPSHISMKSLSMLLLSCCYKLNFFPEIQGEMDRLSHIDLSHTAIQELPSSIVNLPNLSLLNLHCCINLTSLPLGISMLQNLKQLMVGDCVKLGTLPQDLGNIECLDYLGVSSVTRLPSSVALLRNLTAFHCTKRELPFNYLKLVAYIEFSPGLSLLWKQNSSKASDSLYRVLPSLLSLTSLKELSLCNLKEGTPLPVDISTLVSLEYLDLSSNQFVSFPFSISQHFALRTLRLSNCPRLQALPELSPRLSALDAYYCMSLVTITGLLSAKGSFYRCWSLKYQLLDTPTATALQTILQGDNVVRHQTSIILPRSKIPVWFHSETTGVGQAIIELPANWHDVVSGISVCVVGDLMGIAQPVSLSLSTKRLASTNYSGSYLSCLPCTWMGYVSIDLLQHSCMGIVGPDWIINKGRILTLRTENYGVKICGVRLIYKDVTVEEEISNSGNGMTDQGIVLTRQTKILKCLREMEMEHDAITYILPSPIEVLPTGVAKLDSLSWSQKYKCFRAGIFYFNYRSLDVD